jgi:hypothetical protein
MGDHETILKVADVLKNIDDGFLTEIGSKLLLNDVFSDLESLKVSIEQEPLCRVCCYMCVAFNLVVFFVGYVSSFPAPEDLINLSDDALLIAKMFEAQIPHFQKHLTDEYAHIFHDVKVQSFKKPIFGSVHHIPVHPDDLPEGVKIE